MNQSSKKVFKSNQMERKSFDYIQITPADQMTVYKLHFLVQFETNKNIPGQKSHRKSIFYRKN